MGGFIATEISARLVRYEGAWIWEWVKRRVLMVWIASMHMGETASFDDVDCFYEYG